MQLHQGTLLQGGKYKIERMLGQGGFGITYLGEQTSLGRKVAIKEFFMKELCNRDEVSNHVTMGLVGSREMVMKFREKFVKEARSIARLVHPNIVRVIDIFEENGTAYYVMEYCSHGSLALLVKEQYPMGMPEQMALKYICEVASALDYIHQRKMNHLDVKPANIILNESDSAVLIDFGLSKQYDAETGSQTSSTPVGISEGYAPMEQYQKGGVSEFSPSTDIYSLGATFYNLITGNNPPSAVSLNETGLPAFEASESVAKAITSAMQPKRSDRPQCINDWISKIEVHEPAPNSIRNRLARFTDVASGFFSFVKKPKTNADDAQLLQEEQLVENNELTIVDSDSEAIIREEKIANVAEIRDTTEVETQILVESNPTEILTTPLSASSQKPSKFKIILCGIVALMVLALVILSLVNFVEYDVELHCKVSHAELFIDGKKYGSPERNVPLSAGSHEIKVIAEGYKEYTRTIDVGISDRKFTFILSELDAQALYSIGKKYYAEEKYTEAIKWYRKAADRYNADAQYNLGVCYEKGQGVSQDSVEAVKWYRKAADQDNANAQYSLGVCYEKGQGVSQDYVEAVEWYRKSADQGNANAQYSLGVCYKNGQGVKRRNSEEAVRWYKMSADQGNAYAQYNLGVCYKKGEGVPQDYAEAVKWYRMSADQGNADAQFYLGYCYENGEGVPQDYAEAVKWYRKSAIQDNASAQCNLGYFYHHGQGVTQNYKEAVKWYQMSANQGNAYGQNNLGCCYESGQGVPQDKEEAVKWYKKAARQGNELAQANLKRMGITEW